MRISLRQVTKRFGTTPVLRDVSLEVHDHELFFLLGPSGCGKTTLLRVIAGFCAPDTGELWFNDRRLDGVPPHRRNTGMVFQHYALWPHLTVAENVAYGLEIRGVRNPAKRQRIADVLEVVQMLPLADRKPGQLSGGQQQRVALARALVVQPDVLLLDEPLSNLDARLRLELREEIRQIHRQTQITTVYVTHDQKESLSMATRMAVLHDGVIEQIGDPRHVYRHPTTRFVAEFVGETNWLEGRVTEVRHDLVSVETPVARLLAQTRTPVREGQRVSFGFRPEAVQIGEPEADAIPARLTALTYLGELEQYLLELNDGTRVKALEANPREQRRVGSLLHLHVAPHNAFVLPATTLPPQTALRSSPTPACDRPG